MMMLGRADWQIWVSCRWMCWGRMGCMLLTGVENLM
jgi:hypothetical protein